MAAASVQLAVSRPSLAATHLTAIWAYFGFVRGSRPLARPYHSAVYRDRADSARLQTGFDDYKLNHNVYPLPYSMQHSPERAFIHRGVLFRLWWELKYQCV